ncbi:hypothetical protein [Luteolibacter sp. Populi]|uniref:hypothetical protein n=1 Tax=Luteolibacter sp. Populi TaxID=3230487 RepID=UPI0034669337
MNYPRIRAAVTATLASLSACASAASVSAPSTEWTQLAGNYDYLADQQTGQPAGDIVGVGNNAGFFTTFNDNGSASATDGTLGFRLRLDAAGGNDKNPSFDRVAWVGVDADGNGSVDAFLGLGNQGNSSSLGIYAPGSSANTSPNTTSIAASASFSYAIGASNYNYRAVDYLTDGGTSNDATTATSGDADYYLSFLVPFNDLVSYLATKNINISDQSPLRYVVATSTQHNSLNQDLGGVNGGINSTSTWTELGGFSQTTNAMGTVVPEPSAFAIGASLLLLGALRRRRD